MLEVSSAAAAAFEEARTQQDLPADAGVRVFAHQDEEGEVGIALGFIEEPREDDQITEQDGTRIFVAPELAEPLATSVLDVQETPSGAELVIRPQEGADEEA